MGEDACVPPGATCALGDEGCTELTATALSRLTGAAGSLELLSSCATCPGILACAIEAVATGRDKLAVGLVVGRLACEGCDDTAEATSSPFVAATSLGGGAIAFCGLTEVTDAATPLLSRALCPKTSARAPGTVAGAFGGLDFEPLVGTTELAVRGNVFEVVNSRFVCTTSSSGKGGGKKLNNDSGSDVRLIGNSKTVLSSSTVGEVATTGKGLTKPDAKKAAMT
ncbi:hypothetical protein FJY63_08905 [Candidatus Sumerlaeota bacterium]|nr:hypothetical protein [Candidatus Sumerlaeota bacterium]